MQKQTIDLIKVRNSRQIFIQLVANYLKFSPIQCSGQHILQYCSSETSRL